jgi:small subunit ribosomal protein S4
VVNGVLTNVPSYHLRPGDIIEVRGKSKEMLVVKEQVGKKTDIKKFGWLEFNPDRMRGVFLAYPEREQIPEKINEQLIVELYSK